MVNVKLVLSRLTAVTATLFTVRVELLDSCEAPEGVYFAVIVAVPSATPVAVPLDIVAADVLLLLHVTLELFKVETVELPFLTVVSLTV